MADDFEDTSVPDGLTIEDEIALRLGYFLMVWGQAESCLRGTFIALHGPASASPLPLISWLTMTTTAARTKAMSAMAKAAEIPDDLRAAIIAQLSEFDAVSSVRNVYCHSDYEVNPSDFSLISVNNYRVSKSGDWMSDRITGPTEVIRQLTDGYLRAFRLTRTLIPLARRVQEATGAASPDIPRTPPGYDLHQSSQKVCPPPGRGRSKPRQRP